MSSLNTGLRLGVELVSGFEMVAVMLELFIVGSELDVKELEKPVTSGLTNEGAGVELVAL